MKLWKRYVRPQNVEAALQTLQQGGARVIAGGTDLLLDMRQGREAPVRVLVDVSAIEEMRQIRETDRGILVGAAVTHAEIINSHLLHTFAAALVEAASVIGGPQVRNVATLGGNVAHALPAGDGTIALLALDAEAQIASDAGVRWHALPALFQAPGEPSFDRTREILVAFRFPRVGVGAGSSFMRVMRPQGIAIAILNMAIAVKLSPRSIIEEVRLAVGPAAPHPFRARRTENALLGAAWSADLEAYALELLQEEAKLRTSRHRATESYRRRLLGVLFGRTMNAAVERAQNLGAEDA
jgi:carbon-monoxide dehydrogenase medium subunit